MNPYLSTAILTAAALYGVEAGYMSHGEGLIAFLIALVIHNLLFIRHYVERAADEPPTPD